MADISVPKSESPPPQKSVNHFFGKDVGWTLYIFLRGHAKSALHFVSTYVFLLENYFYSFDPISLTFCVQGHGKHNALGSFAKRFTIQIVIS